MELTAVTIDDLEKLGIDAPKEFIFASPDNAIPDTCGYIIGRYNIETDTYDSFFTKDGKNNNIAIFNRCKENCKVYKKRATICTSYKKTKDVINYYLIYNVEKSSRNKPTEADPLVDSNICCNGYYECEYELIFAKEGYSRTIVLKDKTNNNPMYDFINSLEDEINKVLAEEANDTNLFYHVLKQNECSYMDDEYKFQLLMFDRIANITYVDIEKASDLLDMLVSARLLSSKFIEN